MVMGPTTSCNNCSISSGLESSTVFLVTSAVNGERLFVWQGGVHVPGPAVPATGVEREQDQFANYPEMSWRHVRQVLYSTVVSLDTLDLMDNSL